jgi:predicted metalloprotease with PDZ domain
MHVDEGAVTLKLSVQETAQKGKGLGADVDSERRGLLFGDVVAMGQARRSFLNEGVRVVDEGEGICCVVGDGMGSSNRETSVNDWLELEYLVRLKMLQLGTYLSASKYFS